MPWKPSESCGRCGVLPLSKRAVQEVPREQKRCINVFYECELFSYSSTCKETSCSNTDAVMLSFTLPSWNNIYIVILSFMLAFYADWRGWKDKRKTQSEISLTLQRIPASPISTQSSLSRCTFDSTIPTSFSSRRKIR